MKMSFWKHFLDSALIMKDSLWNGKNKVFDVGTGAGFPGIVYLFLIRKQICFCLIF